MSAEQEARLQRALVAMKTLRKRVEDLESVRSEPVAVVGMACRFPGGVRALDAYWDLLEKGKVAIGDMTERFDPSALAGVPTRAGLLDDIAGFDPTLFGISPKEAIALDPQQRLLLEVAWTALEHAGYAPTAIGPQSGGVFVGITSVDFRELISLDPSLDAHAATGAANCFGAGRVSYCLGLEGPSLVVDTACSSSLVAIHLACQSLRRGECSLALAGGVNVIASPLGARLVASTGALAADGECRAFDAGAHGFVRGEGAGIVVLRRLRDALAEGDNVMAVVRGSAVNQDGRSMNLTSPNGQAQVRLIQSALADARVEGGNVTFVEAHGTGTLLGDPIELDALRDAIGSGESSCSVGSVKSNIGHLEAAAGIAGFIKAVLAIQRRAIPGQANFDRLNPRIALEGSRLRIPTRTTSWASAGPRTAGVSSFGMSGTNAHIIVQEAPVPPLRESTARDRSHHVLALGARSPEALRELASAWKSSLEADHPAPLGDLAFTANTGRTHLRSRLAVVGGSHAEMAEAIREALGTGPSEEAENHGTPSVAFLFTGQGSQYAGMAAALYETFAEVRTVLDHCDAVLRPILDTSLLAVLVGSSEADASRIAQTAVAQPALFALEMAIARLWISWGLRPSVVLGHSVGEYAAACLAGIFSLEDGARLIAKRGALMQSTEDGAMAAIAAPAAAVAEALTSLPGPIEIAAINGPSDTVVTGCPEAIDRACAYWEAAGVRSKRLSVSRAFHSAGLEPILDALEREAGTVALSAPSCAIVSNLTGRVARGGEMAFARYWREHARRPVLFGDGVLSAFDHGCRIFLEVGPAATLSAMVPQILDGAGRIRTAASMRRGRNGDRTVLEAMATLYANGVDFDWRTYDRDFGRRRTPAPTYCFQRQTYWPDYSPETAGNTRPGLSSSVSIQRRPAENEPAEREWLRTEGADVAETPEASALRCIAEALRLRPNEIDTRESLRSLGVDSLLAVEIQSSLQKRLGVSPPLVALLEAKSLDALFESLEGLEQREPTPQPRASDSGPIAVDPHAPFPLTDLPEAYLFGRSDAFDFGGVPTTFQLEFDFPVLDVLRLEVAFNRLIERHPMLRAVFSSDANGAFQRVLAETPPYSIAVRDFRRLDSDEREQALREIRAQMRSGTGDATQWPLFDVRVTRLLGDRCRLHVKLDALTVDAYSVGLLFHEWSAFYAEGEPQLPTPLRTYRDVVVSWSQREGSPEYARAWAYWQGRLASLPAAPELPLVRTANEVRRPRFAHRTTRLPAARWSRLKEHAARHGVTPSMAVCTAYAEVLAAWSKTRRFTVNLLVQNRAALGAETKVILGNFTSTLLLEVDVAAGSTFAQCAQKTQKQLMTDLEHQVVSGVRVLRELNRSRGGATTVMPVVFASTLQSDRPADAGLLRALDAITPGVAPVHASIQTPQVWLDHQVLEDDGDLVANWDSVDELFPPELVAEMFGAFVQRLDELAADETAWQRQTGTLVPVSQLAVRAAVNATAAPMREALLHEPFLERVAEDRDRLAVASPSRCLSYGELDRASDAVALWLQRFAVQPNELVAILMERGWEQVVAAMGILKAGAAYVPVDAALPAGRVAHLLRHAKVRCLLTQSWISGAFVPPPGVESLEIDRFDWEAAPRGEIVSAATPRDLAYVIYTSGSTGLPKGVMIEHRSALNTVLDINERLAVGVADRILAISSFSFDLSVYDVFGLLAAGGAVILPAAAEAREPAHWLDLVRSHGVTLWNSVPALLAMLVEYAASQGDVALPFRHAMLSGDWIPVTLPDRVRRLAPGIGILGLGGATEASIWSIQYPIRDVPSEWTSIPYGTPLRNQTFAILDDAMRPRPDWVPGDIYIGGDGLARGYFGDGDKTTASFVRDPWTGERIYRTGDLGRYWPDGTIEFLGREDFQVKVGGYRIELGEIDHALGAVPGVQAAVATAVGDRLERKLIAFIVPTPGATLNERAVLDDLAAKLPAYMVPQRVFVTEKLALTSNGKVDRRALAVPEAIAPKAVERVPPRSDAERVLFSLWRGILGHSDFGIHDNFFVMGGESLRAVRLMAQIGKRFSLDLPLSTLFARPTVASLAELLDTRAPAMRSARTALVPVRTTGRERPMFFAHPVGGDVLCYSALAGALPLEQPFYGLQSMDPVGESSFDTIDAMAEAYVAALREVQPRGPYRLGGWSMGGAIAFDMAQRLRASREEVEALVLVDVTIAPGGPRPVVDDAWLVHAFARDIEALAGRSPDRSLEKRNADAPALLRHAYERLRAVGAWPEEADLLVLEKLFVRFRRHYRALLAYQARALDCPVLFVRSTEGASRDVARSWCSLAGPSEAVDLEGDHYAIVRPPAAATIAAEIRRFLAGASALASSDSREVPSARTVGRKASGETDAHS